MDTEFSMFFFISELMFLETSALTGENVEETFLKCARSILTKIESGIDLMFCLQLWLSSEVLACISKVLRKCHFLIYT